MTLAIVVTVLALMALFAVAIVAIDYATRWPEPVEMARPFPCGTCRCAFHDQAGLARHFSAQHTDATVRTWTRGRMGARGGAV